ncbi:hypothetical protein ACWD5Q_10800 [Streptomyces sp. NPDC002513]
MNQTGLSRRRFIGATSGVAAAATLVNLSGAIVASADTRTWQSATSRNGWPTLDKATDFTIEGSGRKVALAEEDPSRFGAGAGHGLAVESRGGQQSGRHRVFDGPLGSAALLALDRPRGARDLGRRCGSGRDFGDVCAGRRVQGVGVQVGERAAEDAFAEYEVLAGQRVVPGTDAGQFGLRGAGGPLPDRGH